MITYIFFYLMFETITICAFESPHVILLGPAMLKMVMGDFLFPHADRRGMFKSYLLEKDLCRIGTFVIVVAMSNI